MSYDYLSAYEPPVGMLRISIEKGRGFTILKKAFGPEDIPDIYCQVSLGGSRPRRTSTQWNTVAPSWRDETCDFVLYDLDQKIYLRALDDGTTPFDGKEEVGRAEISARRLLQGNDRGTKELELALGDEPHTGCHLTASAELCALSAGLRSLSSARYGGERHLCGLVTVIVTRAFGVPLPREDASTYVKVESRNRTFLTPTVTADYPDNLDPLYSSAFHIPLSMDTAKKEKRLSGAEEAAEDPSSSARSGPRRTPSILSKSINIVEKGIKRRATHDHKDIVFTLMNDNSSNGNAPTELGSFTVTHGSLLRANNHTITEVRPIGEDGASLGFRVRLSGVQSKEERSRQIEADEVPPQDPSRDPFAQTTAEPSFASKKQTIRVTAMQGRGFNVKTRCRY